MKSKKALLSVVAGLSHLLGLALLCFGLAYSFEGLSPVGDLLAPSVGLWRHRATDRDDLIRRLKTAVSEAGLKPVEIEIDENEVPHLKSESEPSLYFAQGFVTAYYRLWQMDFLSRITAGELAEILGEKALPIDRFFRRMRTPAAARASSELMLADPITRGPLTAYTQGVNARIGQIDITSVPIEYRLFRILPEPWSEERAAHLLKFMTWELTGYLYDFRMTASKAKLSREFFDILFPLQSRVPGTILSEAFKTALRFSPEKSTRHFANEAWSMTAVGEVPEDVLPDPSNGSNNWALPARMMSNHRALLANDLHLGYTLPALWFSIQLTTPTMNVYGASLPGAPGVIVGFTETMGWSVTNGTDDVLDWYSLRFRDERRQEYLFEDTWRPVVTRDEVIRVAGGESEIVKTRETHVGPIVFNEGDTAGAIDIPSGLAVQWTGHIPSNELRSFLLLNHAETARDCTSALRGYVAPAQNFVCADRSGRLIYHHAGVFPDRKGRDGRVLWEASRDADLWQGMLPPDENPSLETTTDLIVTANQPPFNGDKLHHYGWFFAAPFRALQIRARLGSKKQWKPEQMIDVQNDTTSLLAQNFKRIVQREATREPLKSEMEKGVCGRTEAPLLRQALMKWDGEHAAEDAMAPLMHRWFKTVEETAWTRLIGPSDQTYWPNSWRFFEMLEKESNAMFWDDARTVETENLNIRLAQALKGACENLKSVFGSRLPQWGVYQSTSIRHAGRIPGLGRTANAGGVAESILANKGQHGPTWKMIVTFEDKPRAWFMLPGGQSGDPASLQYDDHLGDWSRGVMRPVQFKMRENR